MFLQELANLQKLFTDYYLSKQSGRQLVWVHALGTCMLKARFPSGQKELSVSLLQSIVLMLFNGTDKLTFTEIKEQSRIEDKELRRTLLSLACGKVRHLLLCSAWCCCLKSMEQSRCFFNITLSLSVMLRRSLFVTLVCLPLCWYICTTSSSWLHLWCSACLITWHMMSHCLLLLGALQKDTRVLRKEPMGAEVNDDDVLCYNAGFANKLLRIRINTIQLKETPEENKKTNEQVRSMMDGSRATWQPSMFVYSAGVFESIPARLSSVGLCLCDTAHFCALGLPCFKSLMLTYCVDVVRFCKSVSTK